MDFFKRCWAEISLKNVRYNFEQYCKHISKDNEIMCVVKANCYGHSDEEIVPFLQNELGVKYFAVSNLLEAIKLRDIGINGDILILGYTPAENAPELIKYNIIQAITDLDYARSLSKTADSEVRCHCAIDTGMTRIGLHGEVGNICDDLEEMYKLPNIALEGIFTHFAVADEEDEGDISYTKVQADKICKVCEEMKDRNITFKHTHFLNSAGGVYYPDERSTLTRLGIILYGLYPNPAKALPFTPKPVMTLKAVVSQIKYIEKGEQVSYGRTYTADRKIKLATVTAGYADGYPRALSNKGEVIIKGVRCPIRGRVCMDQFMCDVSAVPDVKVGEEVVLMGENITADDIAFLIGTIGYEVTCDISPRVLRLVTDN